MEKKLFKVKTKKNNLRIKLLKLIIQDFYQNRLFEVIKDGWQDELIEKIKQNVSFEFEIIKYKVEDNWLVGKILFNQEDGTEMLIDFSTSSNENNELKQS